LRSSSCCVELTFSSLGALFLAVIMPQSALDRLSE
jgi:hypothetical protein